PRLRQVDAAAKRALDEVIANLRAKRDEYLPVQQVARLRLDEGVIADERTEAVGTNHIGLKIRHGRPHALAAAFAQLRVAGPLDYHAGRPADEIGHVAQQAALPAEETAQPVAEVGQSRIDAALRQLPKRA